MIEYVLVATVAIAGSVDKTYDEVINRYASSHTCQQGAKQYRQTKSPNVINIGCYHVSKD